MTASANRLKHEEKRSGDIISDITGTIQIKEELTDQSVMPFVIID